MVESFGDAVRQLRAVRGRMSLRELARRAVVDPGHLSRIEAGRRPPTRQIAAALDQALAADGALVALAAAEPKPELRPLAVEAWCRADADTLAASLLCEAPTADNALRLAHEWLVAEPPQLYEMRAGRRTGAATVEQVEQRVHQLRLLDDHVGGLDTYQLVTGELDATLTLLRQAAYSEPVGRRLLVAIGELCQLAGWVTADAGRHREATRLYLTGVRAAHAGGDLPGAANNLSSLAYLVANTADPRHGVLMAASAHRGAQHEASATTRALLMERVAWAHARADEPGGADRALGRVEEAYSARRPADDPAWVYWLTQEEIAIMAGRCWTQLHRPLRAVPVLEHATAGYGDDTARESALYLTWLGEAYLQANEVEQAAQTATRALTLTRMAASDRSTQRVEQLRTLLTPYLGTADVDAFEDAYQAGLDHHSN
jgi:transcriptional regulator with XRE-family HTH domain